MRSPCMDCGIDTMPGRKKAVAAGRCDYYMVHDEIWEQAGAGDDANLCVGCLEQRLGRKLTTDDFNWDIRCNLWLPNDTPRLLDRKRSTNPGLVYERVVAKFERLKAEGRIKPREPRYAQCPQG
jgi:hypothetical protein